MKSDVLTASFHKRFPGCAGIGMENARLGSGVTVLFGPSGSGKTTVLRCLAGLERLETGSIDFDGQTWLDVSKQVFMPPRSRGVGFVPQDHALFPHHTVKGNVGYGLADLPGTDRARLLTESLRWLGLEGLKDRWPRELSGGQQQRVALARTIVRQPRLLLLDEPLAALDTPTRLRLRGELRQWLQQLRMATILVTHDPVEALALSDDVLVLHAGHNVEHGPTQEVFSRPSHLAAAEATAVETIQLGRIPETSDGLATVAVGAARITALAKDLPMGTTGVYVCIRAEGVILLRADAIPSSARNHLVPTVRSFLREGPLVHAKLDGGFPLAALLTHQACEELALRSGLKVVVLVKAPQVHLIPFSR